MMNWDERYSEPGFAYGTEPNDFLVEMSDRIPRGSLLSLAEGEGRNAAYLAGLGCQVTAVDSSKVGLQKAQDLAESQSLQINIEHADLSVYQPGLEQWDAVVSIFCHLPKAIRKALYQRVVPSLKPGGVLVLEAYPSRQLEFATGGPRDAELMVELEDIQLELSGLRLEIAREIERDVIEGKYHHGKAVVVQVLAFKD